MARENESFTLPYNTSLNSVVSSLIILLCYGLKTYCTIDLHICNPRIKWLLTNLKEAFSPVKIAKFQTYSWGIKITFVTGFFSAQRCR